MICLHVHLSCSIANVLPGWGRVFPHQLIHFCTKVIARKNIEFVEQNARCEIIYEKSVQVSSLLHCDVLLVSTRRKSCPALLTRVAS